MGEMQTTGRFTFTSRSVPECESFLNIRIRDEAFFTINEFISRHKDISDEILENSVIWYRGNEQIYKDYIAEYIVFSEDLEIVQFNGWKIIINPSIRAALFFVEKATDCLQNARYFAMKSNLILDCNRNIPWSHGYIAQFSLRCTYFGTAATWYSNTFDQVLQAVYWAYELYTSAIDKKKRKYADTWDVKKTMKFCTYDFVIAELKKRGNIKVRGYLTSCFGKIEEVRSWANYIKHKGGIEYSYLEAEPPFQIYVFPADGTSPMNKPPDDRFAIKNFKSPVEVDIDSKMGVIVDAHKALVKCIKNIIDEINFDKHQLRLGGE